MNVMVFLDIETTSLESDAGIIVAIGLGYENGEIKIYFANSHDEEEKIISNVFMKIANQNVITFNGTRFDIPFLLTRGLRYNLFLPKLTNIDLYFWAAKYLRLQSRKFHDICMFYGIPHEEINGREVSELYIRSLSGDKLAKERITDHLKQDISAMRILYNKIK